MIPPIFSPICQSLVQSLFRSSNTQELHLQRQYGILMPPLRSPFNTLCRFQSRTWLPKPLFQYLFPSQLPLPLQFLPPHILQILHPFPHLSQATNPFPIQYKVFPPLHLPKKIPANPNIVPMVPKTFTAPFPQAPMSPGIQRVSNQEFHRTNSMPTFSSYQGLESPTKDRGASAGPSMQPRDYERKPHPIVAFGFGGKLVTMIPRKRCENTRKL
jgi:hypothetical protein